jgi:hypothetical protein
VAVGGQLGKSRGRWYAPTWLERLIPLRYRGLRNTGDFALAVGDVVPDYGPDGRFTVEVLEPPRALVYSSFRKSTTFTWALLLTDLADGRCRLHLRLRISKAGRVTGTVGCSGCARRSRHRCSDGESDGSSAVGSVGPFWSALPDRWTSQSPRGCSPPYGWHARATPRGTSVPFDVLPGAPEGGHTASRPASDTAHDTQTGRS